MKIYRIRHKGARAGHVFSLAYPCPDGRRVRQYTDLQCAVDEGKRIAAELVLQDGVRAKASESPGEEGEAIYAACVPQASDRPSDRLEKARAYMRMYRRVLRRLDRVTAHLLTQYKITSSQYLLLLRVMVEGKLTQAQVGKVLDSDPNTVSALVHRLEGRGLLTRTAHPTDRRAYLLQITPKGSALVTPIRARLDVLTLRAYELLPRGHEAAIAEWLIGLADFDAVL